MKNIGLMLMAVAMVLTTGCSAADSASPGSAVQTSTAQVAGGITVTSSGIVDGVMDPAYGSNGEVKENGIPALSLPLEITGAPEGIACFAVYMDDPDAEPLCGYRWVHWMAVNISISSLPEDFSRTAGRAAIQGKNDSGTTGYAGPQPPDKDHTYVITVCALDAELSLTEGFTKEEFAAAIEGHVLATAALEGIYRK